MATISEVIDNGPAVTLASPVYIIVTDSKAIEFEVLETDAASLHSQLGRKRFLAIDGATFWGELVSLEPCTSTAAGLCMLRQQPALRGVVRIFPGEPGAVQ